MSTIAEMWDQTFALVGRSCPAQKADEDATSYLRRLSIIGKRYLPNDEQVKQVTFKRLPDNVVEKYSGLVRAAVERSLYRTDNMRDGEMRPIRKSDAGGTKITEWVGPTSFVRELTTPCRKVVSISMPARETLYSANRAHLRGMFGGG